MVFGIPVESIQHQDGIALRSLKPGTVLTIETFNSIYQATIIKAEEATITGGLLRDGSVRFSKPTPATLMGANWGTHFKLGWIGRGMRLAIGVGETMIETSPVLNVVLDGPDWHYSMDWNKEAHA